MAEELRLVVDRALLALSALEARGGEIGADEVYVAGLADAQRARLRAIADRRGRSVVAADRRRAIDLLCAEADRIDDPHRAIDWLSTFPDLVALALDEPIGGPPPGGR